MAKRVYLAVGTKKGAFIAESSPARDSWEVRGPYLGGQSIMHMALDARTGALFAASGDPWFGSRIYRSEDLGHTWDEPVGGPAFSEESGDKLEKIWEVVPGRESEPGVVYAGAEPASLFKSTDNGKSWALVQSLKDHPTNNTWFPSAGGLCLHSITLDPTDVNRMYIAISAGGFYATTDGGKTWEPRNKGVRAEFLADSTAGRYPESGQCVHRVGLHASNPQRLYQQNHCGVYRSEDGGLNWTEITANLPSDWGLALAVHSHDPNSIFVCQGTSQMEHWPHDGKFVVYRTRDAGGSWQRLDEGLPKDAYVNVHREGLCVDNEDPCGVYVGANTGQLWASRDEGDSWQLVPAMFPAISSVTAFSA